MALLDILMSLDHSRFKITVTKHPIRQNFKDNVNGHTRIVHLGKIMDQAY